MMYQTNFETIKNKKKHSNLSALNKYALNYS